MCTICLARDRRDFFPRSAHEHRALRRTLLTRYSVRRKPCSGVVDATRFIIQKAASLPLVYTRSRRRTSRVESAGCLANVFFARARGYRTLRLSIFRHPLGASHVPPLSSSRCRIPSPFVASR
jgi:hypothetical protein